MAHKGQCSIDGCDYPAKTRGWCQAHYMRWYMKGDPGSADIVRRPKGKTCCLDGCDRKHQGRGYCGTHLQRFIKHGDPGPAEIELRAPDRGCLVDDCDRKHFGSGYCEMHLQRIRKRGTLELPPHHMWIGNAARYSTVHQRIRRAKGKAADHLCVLCGGPASQWAYDHADPDEQMSDDGRPYRLDLDRYRPMCALCHRRFDVEHLPKVMCSADGCDRPQKARELCTLHYQRWKKSRRQE